jgi:membrane-bound lytic murein transglycosylase D
MPSTARDYGLKLNRWVDERRDPEKATVAAAEHLRLLYSRLRDWNLVLGAYNGGLGNIRRALAGTHTRDFWKLEQLPPETYNFVPNFYAILHILSSPEKHGLKLPEPLPAMQYETIDLEATFSMEQLAALTNLSIAEIETYNPALIGKLAPSGGYKIKLPVGAKQTFLHQYSTTPTQQIRIVYTDYKVRKGDTIANLAKAYGTSVSAIKLDNNLVDSRLKAGQLLRIATFEFEPEDSKEIRETGVVDEERKQGTQELARQEFRHRAGKSRVSLEAVARYYAVSVDDLYGWNKHLRSPHLNAGEEALIYKPVDKVITHRTRRGDSLWDLSRRYQTSISDIRRWNNLRDSKIYPGDKLVVRLK